jgi:predicted nucleic acid-binding protein
MAIKYLLDTNIVSDLVRPIPNTGVAQRIQETTGEVAIAATIWHELAIRRFQIATIQKAFRPGTVSERCHSPFTHFVLRC